MLDQVYQLYAGGAHGALPRYMPFALYLSSRKVGAPGYNRANAYSKRRKKTKNLIRVTVLAIIIVPFLTGQLLAKEEKINKTYKNIKRLDIETVSGDCIIEGGKGNKITVKVVYDYPDECFEAELTKRGNRLRLKERFRGYRDCSGTSEWTITVPKGIDIDFSSASGDVSVTGCEGEFTFESASGRIEIEKTEGEFEIDNASGRIEISNSNGEFEIDNASGRIRMQNVSGEFEIDNASGNVDIENAKGQFEVDNASGGIDAAEILIEDRSTFDTASGDIVVMLAKSAEHDISLESASGDVVLNYNGNPVIGFFEFSARKGRGRIIAPYKFDKEEEYEYQGRVYLKKSFTKEKETPKIILETHSGRAELKLK